MSTRFDDFEFDIKYPPSLPLNTARKKDLGDLLKFLPENAKNYYRQFL